ncbi:MAG: ABC transporter ATP-binding protein [Actinobacteria bacterium]|nr:ABC transporter ATP-binding protein [Actinomycetota bacterium]
MDAIVASGLTKHFGATQALVDLDLDIPVGEVFGFLGPNGAGKTTTIRLLMGLLNATAGSAQVLGRDARAEAVELHRRVGYLPSDPVFPRGMPGRDYLAQLGRLRGGVSEARVAELTERLELDLDKPITALSRGNRQKVGIVQAFMHDPDLVVLDEASSGLDPLKQIVLNRLVSEVAAEGRTVFLSSHVIAEVEEVASRVGIIRQGRLVALAGIEELRARAVRRVEIRFAAPVPAAPFAALPGVDDVRVVDRSVHLTVTGSMDPLVKLAARHEVETFTSDEAELTDVFLGYYEEDEA